MANSKIKVLLKKIESIIGEEESISNLELDLVKSYLRDVYVLTDNLAPMSQAPASKRQSEVKSSPVSNHSVTEHIIPPQDPVKIRAIPPQEIEHVANKSQPADGLSEYSQKLPNGREDVLGAERTNIISKEQTPPEPTLIKEVPPVFRTEVQSPQKYDILFRKSGSEELSDKLSRSPISDLHKALGINDRMLVVAELFNADQHKFAETMDILNGKYSFEEAKSYLIRYIIDQFKWLDEEKVERAQEFVKLIERRYIEA